MDYDVLVIGAGVIGCAVARELSRYRGRIGVLEKGFDVAEGASKANSGIVHAGFDAKPGTLKAKLNVEGAKLYPRLCQELGVPYTQPGALVLGFTDGDRRTLEKLLRQGLENGVEGLCILQREEVLAMEPNTNPQVLCALYAPSSGLTSPYELTFALADHGAVNGVEYLLGQQVTGVEKNSQGLWQVTTDCNCYTCKVLVNCAGSSSAYIHNRMGGPKLSISPRRGQYYLLDRMEKPIFQRTMFQCPTKLGKGVLVSPTVHGNLLLGPSAEDVPDETDVSTTAEGLAFVLEKSRLTWPDAGVKGSITNFSGIRAHEEQGDFVIGKVAQNGYEAVGIESPGLSAAPAIAKMLEELIAREQGLEKKETFLPPVSLKKPFYEMTEQERAEAVREDPLYGNLVCRCEMVTEAEIRQAIRRPVGATTVDGIKRRTRSTMGRCQGGFCTPRLVQILAQELGIPVTQVTKSGGNSFLLTGSILQALEED